MKYLLLITYSWDTDYIAIPCKTEVEAIEKLNSYLNEEINVIKTEQGFEPTLFRYADTEVELAYAIEDLVDVSTDKSIYKVIEIGHGYINKQNIRNATFTSDWEDYGEVTTNCKVNTLTKEVFDIEISDVNIDDDILIREFVIVDGEEYDVVDRSEANNETYWRK